MRVALVAVVVVTVCLGTAGCLRDVEVRDGPTWFGFGDGQLLEQNVGGSGYPLAWGTADWLAGNPPPTWRTGAFTDAAWVVNATLTVTFDLSNVVNLDLPVRPFSRPPLTAWFGTASGSVVSHEFAAGPTAAAQASQTAEWDIPLPPGGLYVQQGDALSVSVGTYYLHYEGVRLDGSESRLDVVLVQAPPRDDATAAGGATLQVAGGACILRDPSGLLDAQLLDLATAEVTFDVPDGTTFLHVAVRAPMGDVDFLLTDPGGEEVVHALGPGSAEEVLLGPDNLAGRAGTWTLTAYACSTYVGDIDASWTLAGPDP